MRTTVNGLEISYQSIGRHDDVLLLLHGWGNNWEAWSPLIPWLSRRYQLLIPDLPGFGASHSPREGWGMAEYTAWLEAFLQKLKIDTLSGVLGHSFGGKLAAFGWWSEQAALPTVEKGFYLFDPSGIIGELPFSRRLLRDFAHLIPHSVKRGLLAQFRKTVYTKLLNETDYYSATEFQEATLNRILSEDIRDWSIQRDFPLHFCWGEHDDATPLWMAYPFRTISQNSDVFVVPGAGHFPHHEKPELVKRWLEANGV